VEDNVRNDLLQHFASCFELLDTRPVYEWAKENAFLPMGYEKRGKFNPPAHIILPMSWLNDSSVRGITLAAAVQNLKSTSNEIYTLFTILQSPGNMLRIHQKDDAAQECMTTRIIPMMGNNEKLRAILKASTYNAKTGFLKLPNGTFIKSCGPSKNNLQSKTIKYLVIEELKFFDDPTLLYEAVARTERYEKTRKIIICSEPDFEGSTLHAEFSQGDQYVFGWHCPSCKKLQPYEFNGERDGKYFGLVWSPQNEEGTLSDDARTNDTRLVCQHCFHEVKDTADNRLALINRQDNYILTAKGKKSEYKAASWSCFVDPEKSYKSIAQDYLTAKRNYEATGIREHIHRFYNKKMGIFTKQGLQIDLPKLMADVSSNDGKWPDETHRFLTIDVQKGCMYWVVSAWSNKVAEARLIDWGVCVGYDEITNIKNKYGIKPMHIAIDSGDDTKPIYKESVQRGELFTDGKGKKHFVPWVCLKGDGGKITPKISYKHPDGEKYYGMETRPDCQWPAGSKFSQFRARLYLWSNYSVKTILSNIRDGKVPFKLRYNERADETFTKQMFSEEINPKTGRFDSYDRPNHLWDCMCMALVLALMSKCYIPEASSVTLPTVKEEAQKT
jgi:hypothetical protein